MKGFRTFIVAAAGVIAGGIGVFNDTSDWTAWGLLILAAAMAGLRAVTNTAPGKSA